LYQENKANLELFHEISLIEKKVIPHSHSLEDLLSGKGTDMVQTKPQVVVHPQS